MTTRPLRVVRDPGPDARWFALPDDVSEALHKPPSYAVHDLAAKAIIGLAGMLLGCLWTLFTLAMLEVL